MTTMLEKVARAVAAIRWDTYKPTPTFKDYDIARAALLAMREPDEGMRAAPETNHLENCSEKIASEWRLEYLRIFTAMIDHALNESQP
jgi:hypothetical protein